jgi:hypothetical protein
VRVVAVEGDEIGVVMTVAEAQFLCAQFGLITTNEAFNKAKACSFHGRFTPHGLDENSLRRR